MQTEISTIAYTQNGDVKMSESMRKTAQYILQYLRRYTFSAINSTISLAEQGIETTVAKVRASLYFNGGRYHGKPRKQMMYWVLLKLPENQYEWQMFEYDDSKPLEFMIRRVYVGPSIPERRARVEEIKTIVNSGTPMLRMEEYKLLHEAMSLCLDLGYDAAWHNFHKLADRIIRAVRAEKEAGKLE